MENNYTYDWDDEIVNENSDFILIPDGDYEFTVEKFERGTFDGSSKLPSCKKAIVTFSIKAVEGTVSITENFLLCSSLEWKLSSLFLSVSMKKHGEPLRMNWSGLIGKTGRCHVIVDKFTKKDGSEGKSNKISKFYAYDDKINVINSQQTQPASVNWKAGNF